MSTAAPVNPTGTSMGEKAVPMEYPDDGHIFVCVRVRNAALLPCMTSAVDGGTTPRVPKHERRLASRICVSSVENVVVMHEPKTLDDGSSVARDTNNVVQLLTERAHARSTKAAHKANLLASKLLTPTPTANFYECDACLNSMDEASMMAMPIIKNSDFLRPPPYGTQEDIYLTTAAHAVRAAVEGINSCVFAYGQTGSGKTYTLFGDTTCLARDPGIVPRTLDDLFDQLNALKEDHISDTVTEYSYSVHLSLFEIYNNDVYCLFSRQGPLRVNFNREPNTTRETMVIHNLQTHVVTSASKAFPLVEMGLRHRQTSETGMNARSSRSHAILQMAVTQWRTNRLTRETVQLHSTINLVDLAGSERQKTARTDGKTREEGIQINQSLATLARVINDISRGAKYINYRDSLLTMVLKDNLGGNSKTFMVATVSPLAFCYQESCATLAYARDVRKIRNRPVVNKSFQTRANLLELNARLKNENDQLRLHIEQLLGERPANDSGRSNEAAPVDASPHRGAGAGPARTLGELIWEPSQHATPQLEAVLTQQADSVLAPLVVSAQRTYQQCTGAGVSCFEGVVRVTVLQHEAMHIRLNKVVTGLSDNAPDLGAIEFECVSQRKCDKRYWLRYIPGTVADSSASNPYSVDVRVNGMRFMTDRHEMAHGDVVAVFVDQENDDDAVQRLLTFHYVDVMSLSRHSVLGKRQQGLEALQFGALRVSVDMPGSSDNNEEDINEEGAQSSSADDLQERIRHLERENAKLMQMLRSQASTIEYQHQKARETSQPHFVSRAASVSEGSNCSSPAISFPSEGGVDYSTLPDDRYNIPTQRTTVSPSLVRCGLIAGEESNDGFTAEPTLPHSVFRRHTAMEDLQRRIEQLRMSGERDHSTGPSSATAGSGASSHATVRKRAFYAVDCLQGNQSDLENSEEIEMGKPQRMEVVASQSRDDVLMYTTNNLALGSGQCTRDCSSPSIVASHNVTGVEETSGTFSGALDSVYAARTPHCSSSSGTTVGVSGQDCVTVQSVVGERNSLSRPSLSLQDHPASGLMDKVVVPFTLPSADEILRRHRRAPDCLNLPTSEGVCERFLSAKRERVLCERIWELEELLDGVRGETALLEGRCRIGKDSLLEAEVRIAQLKDDMADLERALEDARDENRVLSSELYMVEELLHKTEDTLAAISVLSESELNERLSALLESQNTLRALARMWKRRAMQRILRESSACGVGDGRDYQIPWECLSAEANAAAAKRLLGDVSCTPVAAAELERFERDTAQDAVVVMEKLLCDFEQNNRLLRSELKSYRDELASNIDLVERLRCELAEMDKREEARDPSALGTTAVEQDRADYVRKCQELAEAEQKLAEITAKLNGVTDDCEAVQRLSTQSNELLLLEQRRIIDMQSGEQARLSAKLEAKDEELRTALSFMEEQAATVDSGSQMDMAMREQLEKLIEEAINGLERSGPGVYSAFPQDFQFSDQLVVLIRICLRVLMDRLKVELYVLNRHNVHKFGLLVPAISLRPETQFNSFMHELRGVVAEMSGKSQKIGSRWALSEADILEKLVDHRRRRAGDALCGLLVWYDHWDMSPKSEHVSYVELIRNTERVLQIARQVRLESRLNTNASSTQGFPVPTSNNKIDAMYLDGEALDNDKSVQRSVKILHHLNSETMKSNLARCVARFRTPSSDARSKADPPETGGNTDGTTIPPANTNQTTPNRQIPTEVDCLSGSRRGVFCTPRGDAATATPPSGLRFHPSPSHTASGGSRSAFKETLSSTVLQTIDCVNTAEQRETVVPMTDVDLAVVGADMMVRQDSLNTYNFNRRMSSTALSARGPAVGGEGRSFGRNKSASAAVGREKRHLTIISSKGTFARYPTATTASGDTVRFSINSDIATLTMEKAKKPLQHGRREAEPVSIQFMRIGTDTSSVGMLGKRAAGTSTAGRVTKKTHKSEKGPRSALARGRVTNVAYPAPSSVSAVASGTPDAGPPPTVVATSRPDSTCLSPLSSAVSSSTVSVSSGRVRGTMGSGTSSPSLLWLGQSSNARSSGSILDPVSTVHSYYDPEVMHSLSIREDGEEMGYGRKKRPIASTQTKKEAQGIRRAGSRGAGIAGSGKVKRGLTAAVAPGGGPTAAGKTSPTPFVTVASGRGGSSGAGRRQTPLSGQLAHDALKRTTTPNNLAVRRLSPLRRAATGATAKMTSSERSTMRSPLTRQVTSPTLPHAKLKRQLTALGSHRVEGTGGGALRRVTPKRQVCRTASGTARVEAPTSTTQLLPAAALGDSVPKLDMVTLRVRGLK